MSFVAPEIPDTDPAEAGDVNVFCVPKKFLQTNLKRGKAVKLSAEDVKDEKLAPFIKKCLAPAVTGQNKRRKSECQNFNSPSKPRYGYEHGQSLQRLHSKSSSGSPLKIVTHKTEEKEPEMATKHGMWSRESRGVPQLDLRGQAEKIEAELDAKVQAYLEMPDTEIPVNAIWEFMNSQDEVQKALAKRKEEIEKKHREHQEWLAHKNKKHTPDETKDSSPVRAVKTQERPSSPTIEDYQLSAKALVAMRLEREAEMAELERLENLEVARQRRIAARQKDRQQQRERRASELLIKKQNAFVKTLVESTFPKNGGLFYSTQVSHGAPVSCLPVSYTEAQAVGSGAEFEFWQNHLHLTCQSSSWALPNIAYLLSRPEFVAVQLCEEDTGPMFHVVLGCAGSSAVWAEISGVTVKGGIGQNIKQCMRVATSHHVFDTAALSIYASRGKDVPAGAPVRSAKQHHSEACIGILKGKQTEQSFLEILKSPKAAGLRLMGLRSVYLTDEQKAWAQPRVLANLSGKSDLSGVQSGPVIVLCVTGPETGGETSGERVRDQWDSVFGPLDPALGRKLAPKTLRAKFGTTKEDNLIYVSRSCFKDQKNSVTSEIAFFFAGRLANNDKATAEDGSKRVLSTLVF